jgi:hypothetical protein
LGGLAVGGGFEICCKEDLRESFDGVGSEFGGLDSCAGVGGSLDEGDFLLDFWCFEPLGDGGDGGVELFGDVGEGVGSGEDGGEEGAFVRVLGERAAGSHPP